MGLHKMEVRNPLSIMIELIVILTLSLEDVGKSVLNFYFFSSPQVHRLVFVDHFLLVIFDSNTQ